MSNTLQNPSLRQRLTPLLKGFDGPLAFGVFLLACAGLLIMYSSGFANGARFVDHGRNMLLAGFIMFMVAQVPPQRLMALAVPLYTIGVALLVAVALFVLLLLFRSVVSAVAVFVLLLTVLFLAVLPVVLWLVLTLVVVAL